MLSQAGCGAAAQRLATSGISTLSVATHGFETHTLQVDRVSSRITLFFRYVFFPSMGLTSVVAAVVATTKPDFPSALAAGLVVGAAVTLSLLFHYARRLWSVHIDGDELVLSNLIRRVRIPARQLERVRSTALTAPQFVTLRFREDTPCGRRIAFIPPFRLFAIFTHSPVVAKLKRFADDNRRAEAARIG